MKTKKIETPRLWRGLLPHPLSELVEFGEGIDLEGLAGHMSRNGYDHTEPVILFGGKILDGRHRNDAAQKAEVEPVYRELVGTDQDARNFVLKKVFRQHLSTSQRAMIAAKVADLAAGDNQHTANAGTSQGEAADALNVSEDSVNRAKIVQEKCTPAVQRAVRTNEISVSDAAAAAEFPKPQQDKALQAVRDKKYKTLAAALGPPKKKKPSKPQPDGLPKSVANALADTWHAECARLLSKMAKECKGAFSWSSWLDGAVLDHLKAAEECFLTAVPTKVCPECKGQKKIDKQPCENCRHGGYMASQC